MSFTNETVKVLFVGDNSTTTFAIAHELVENPNTTIEVYLRDETDPLNIIETLQILTTNYTLTPSVDPVNVEMNIAPTSDEKLLIKRNVPNTQTTDLLNTGPAPLETVEISFDRVVAMVQEHAEKLTRAALFSVTSSQSAVMPEPEADKMLAWNTGGTDLENKSADDILNLTDALAVANNLSDVQSASASVANLGIDPLRTAIAAAFADNQGATAVTGLDFDGTVQSVIKCEWASNQAGGTKMGGGSFRLLYNGANWSIQNGEVQSDAGSPPDLAFNFTESGANNKDVQVTLATGVGSGAGNTKIKFHGYLVS